MKSYSLQLLLLTSFLFIMPTLHAQKKIRGQIKNKTTQSSLSNVTLKWLKANIATQSNAKGFFELERSTKAEDTLFFNAIGYEMLKIPAVGFTNGQSVYLQESNVTLNEVIIAKKKQKQKTATLGRFNDAYADVITTGNHFINYNGPVNLKESYITAKLFNNKNKPSLLQSIKIERNSTFNVFTNKLHYESNISFKVHVYDVDTLNGGPGIELYPGGWLVDNPGDIKTIELNVGQHYILLRSEVFFIAIEWLPLPMNEHFVMDINRITAFYEPSILGYLHRDHRRGIPLWSLFKDTWEPTVLRNGGRYTDLAISATVKYE